MLSSAGQRAKVNWVARASLGRVIVRAVNEARDLTGRCGTCAFFMRLHTNADGASSGECRLGCWPAPLKDVGTCASHKAVGTPWSKPGAKSGTTRTRIARGAATERTPQERMALPQELGIDMDQSEFRQVLREILLDELGVRDTELGERWVHGEMVLVPGKAGTAEKRIPLDSLFRKIVLIREKLRVLEQKINNHDKLDDNDRLQLQQYVTGCYGSLTTFNVLFRDKDDQFTGQASKDD